MELIQSDRRHPWKPTSNSTCKDGRLNDLILMIRDKTGFCSQRSII